MSYEAAVVSWFKAVRNASSETWRHSVKEVVVIATISIFPLLARFAWYYFKDLPQEEPQGFIKVFCDQILNGQLLLFSISNFAAIFWLSQQEVRDRFDARVWFSLLSLVGWGICGFLIGFDPDFRGVPQVGLQIMSGILFIVSIIVNIMILVFVNFSGVDFGRVQTSEETDTTDRLNRRRNG